jgi:hypothetical protein
MKARKPAGTKRRSAAEARRDQAHSGAVDEPKVSGLERDGDIRLTQLLRALTGELPARIKPVH